MPNKYISNWQEQKLTRFLEIVFDFKVYIYVKCQVWGNVGKHFKNFIDWKWKPAMYRKFLDYAPLKKFFNRKIEFVVLFLFTMICSIYRTFDIFTNETTNCISCNKRNMHFLNLILKCFSLNFAHARVSKQPNAQD